MIKLQEKTIQKHIQEDKENILLYRNNKDIQGFNNIYNKYKSFVKYKVKHLLGRYEILKNGTKTPDDYIQETFIRLFNSFEKINESSYLKAYISSIIKNIFIDEWRRISNRDTDKSTIVPNVSNTCNCKNSDNCIHNIVLENNIEEKIDNTHISTIINIAIDKTINNTYKDVIKEYLITYDKHSEIDGNNMSNTLAKKYNIHPITLRINVMRGKEKIKKYIMKNYKEFGNDT